MCTRKIKNIISAIFSRLCYNSSRWLFCEKILREYTLNKTICVCSVEFTGDFCENVVVCEINCQNGGFCEMKSGNHTCLCPATHTGDLCENEVTQESTGSHRTTTISVFMSIVGAVIIFGTVLFTIVFFKKRKLSSGATVSYHHVHIEE